jgi:hypothetical protein
VVLQEAAEAAEEGFEEDLLRVFVVKITHDQDTEAQRRPSP